MQKFRIKKSRSDKPPASCSLMAGESDPSSKVEKDGGKFGNGLIRDPAVISRGEALGHYFWIDSEMLQQVADALNDAGTTGVKSRLGHPNWSDDGTGRSLGRFVGGRLDGDTVRAAGLHVSNAASKSPAGDLADWLMTQAADDPEAIGVSIEFEHDYEAEISFLESNGAIWEQDSIGRYLNLDNFKSPDPLNIDNLPHGRLRKLRAADIVDTPASNPSGLLSEKDQDDEAQRVADYIAGVTDEAPAEFLSMPSSLLREKISGLMAKKTEGEEMKKTQLKADRNNPKKDQADEPEVDEPEVDEPEADEPEVDEPEADEPEVDEPEVDESSQLSGAQALVKKYSDRYGEKGAKYLTSGLSLEQAQVKYNQEIREENESLSSRLSAIEAAGGSLGDEDGVSHNPAGGTTKKEKRNGLTGLAAALHTGIEARTKKKN